MAHEWLFRTSSACEFLKRKGKHLRGSYYVDGWSERKDRKHGLGLVNPAYIIHEISPARATCLDPTRTFTSSRRNGSNCLSDLSKYFLKTPKYGGPVQLPTTTAPVRNPSPGQTPQIWTSASYGPQTSHMSSSQISPIFPRITSASTICTMRWVGRSWAM